MYILLHLCFFMLITACTSKQPHLQENNKNNTINHGKFGRYIRNIGSIKYPLPKVTPAAHAFKLETTSMNRLLTTVRSFLNIPNPKSQAATTNKMITTVKSVTASNVIAIKSQSMNNTNKLPSNATVNGTLSMCNQTMLKNVTPKLNTSNVQCKINTPRIRKKVRAYEEGFKYGIKLQPFYKTLCEASGLCELYPPGGEYKFAGQTSIPMSQGLLITHCSNGTKHYFISKELKTRPNFYRHCCSYGMLSGLVETREELNCIYDAYTNFTEYYKNVTQMKEESKSFSSKKITDYSFSKTNIVSGDYTDEGLNRDFVTCIDGSYLPEDLWAPNQPDNIDGWQGCSGINLNGTKETIGYDDVRCLDSIHVMCQATIVKKKKIKKADGYNADIIRQYKSNSFKKMSCETKNLECKLLNDNNKAGYKFAGLDKVNISTGILMTGCASDRHFFISADHQCFHPASHKYCCSIGMAPAVIKDRDELNCINEQFKNASGEKYFNLKRAFHLSYYDDTFDRNFVSCLDKIPLPEDLYGQDEPDNFLMSQNCVGVLLGTKKYGLTDYGTADISSPMCERVLPLSERKASLQQYTKTFVASTQIKTKNGTEDICKESKCTQKKPVVFNYDTFILLNNTKGLAVTSCGKKTFYLGNKRIKGQDIWKECCELGMEPASMNTKDEFNCVYNAFKSSISGKTNVTFDGMKHFLVAYMDINLNFTYASCPDKQELPINLWAPNQPDNFKGIENCVVAHFDYNIKNVGYDDVACHKDNFLYICQTFYNPALEFEFSRF